MRGLRQISHGRFHHQVKVVVHQTIGVQPEMKTRDDVRQHHKEPLPIFVIQKDVLPSIAPSRPVVERACFEVIGVRAKLLGCSGDWNALLHHNPETVARVALINARLVLERLYNDALSLPCLAEDVAIIVDVGQNFLHENVLRTKRVAIDCDRIADLNRFRYPHSSHWAYGGCCEMGLVLIQRRALVFHADRPRLVLSGLTGLPRLLRFVLREPDGQEDDQCHSGYTGQQSGGGTQYLTSMLLMNAFRQRREKQGWSECQAYENTVENKVWANQLPKGSEASLVPRGRRRNHDHRTGCKKPHPREHP